jgi:hypothetical protein
MTGHDDVSPAVDTTPSTRLALPFDAYCNHPGVTTASQREPGPDRRRVRDRNRGKALVRSRRS